MEPFIKSKKCPSEKCPVIVPVTAPFYKLQPLQHASFIAKLFTVETLSDLSPGDVKKKEFSQAMCINFSASLFKQWIALGSG